MNLTLEPPVESTYHGLVNCQGRVDPGSRPSLSPSLRVTIAGSSYALPLVARAGDASGEFSFVLNTLKLENGSHPLTFELCAAPFAGTVVARRDLTVVVDNPGALARRVTRLMRDSDRTPYIFTRPIDASDFDYDSAREFSWIERSNAHALVPDIALRHALSRHEQRLLEGFVADGFLVLPGAVSDATTAQINHQVDRILARGKGAALQRPDGRVEHIFLHSSATRALWKLPSVMRVLAAIFDAEPVPSQTLNFQHGSEQGVHQDTIHLTPFPQGTMCGVWLALEDVHEDAGPLVYYPGSHRLPRLYAGTLGLAKVLDGNWDAYSAYGARLQALLDDRGMTPEVHLPKKGTVLIWHENLAHGGSPRIDPARTRRSIVSHYFARGSASFADSQGFACFQWTDEQLERRLAQLSPRRPHDDTPATTLRRATNDGAIAGWASRAVSQAPWLRRLIDRIL